MQSLELLNWAMRTLSFFNTITLLWLGLTVLLNAERRTWGTWVVGGGLLLGGTFFVAHSAVVGAGFDALYAEMEPGWHAIWLLFISHPYLWYLAIAWYTGTLRAGRYRFWFFFMSLIGIMATALMLLASPIPPYREFLQQAPNSFLVFAGIPVVILIYPVYSILCFALALSMLRRPLPAERFMGELARKRARPWLVGASFALLGVSLSIGGAAMWFLHALQAQELTLFSPQLLTMLTGFDLLISSLLAAAIVLVGQAIVSYEVFTGKALPRGGLFRHWRNSLILAAGYGALLAASLDLPVDPIYRILLATVLMTTFYALLSWRSYLEREQGMERLRPFVTSQRLYERLLSPTTPLEVDTATPFRALCDEILGARLAYLTALGPLAPLVGPPLAHPKGEFPSLPALSDLTEQLRTPQPICIPLDPTRFSGAVWAVPLWSERGLIGVLLLGEKRDGRLYAQEEIEIARAVCERLIDTQASAEMARRLMALQRQRLAESQVLDHSTRRALHDDVLPRLHTALLTLSSVRDGSKEVREASEILADAHRLIANLMQSIPPTAAPEVARLGLIDALRQSVDGELCDAFDSVRWQVETEAEHAVRAIPTLAAEVVFFAAREAIRNAAHHGRAGEDGRPLHLSVLVTWNKGLQIAVEDDGVGLSSMPSATAGSGQGLALHSTMMAVIGGTLAAESASGGARVVLTLPQEYCT